MTPAKSRVIFASALSLVLALLSGCSPMGPYIFRQGVGQIGMMLSTEPIDDVLADGVLTPEQERKLRLIVETREFARGKLGLHVGGSFRLYHDTGGKPVAYNLSAARKDALVSKSWRFPLVGSIDYLGYFSRADADAAAARLERDGYDTYIYGVDAYSTLGWFSDPVQSSFLKRSEGDLVETVIHELAHNTVYASGQSTFNESLATYVGRRGARRFFEQRAAEGRATLAELEQSYADRELITTWMTATEATLREYYAQDIPSAEKIAGREAIFQAARDRFAGEVQPALKAPDRYRTWAKLPTNNAFVLLHRRYNLDLDVFAAADERSGGDFAKFLDVLRAAAKTSDPFAYLRQVAGSP
jgi:predicted aminopeptidase